MKIFRGIKMDAKNTQKHIFSQQEVMVADENEKSEELSALNWGKACEITA